MKMKRLVNYIQKTNQRQATRKQLLELPDEMLKDIAISRVEVNKEAQKYFWQ